jgi:TonB family protein
VHLRRLIALLLFAPFASSALAASPRTTSGITADGRVITVGPYKPRPWAADRTKKVEPRLSASERAKGHEGEGLFCVILDTDSGAVRRVVILNSSGYFAIDQTIVDALQQWRFRPHRWKQFEIYVGLWLKPPGPNHVMQPTAGRRTALLFDH